MAGHAEVKLVSNAMANATRRKIMNMLLEKGLSKADIGRAVGQSMLDYHLQILQQAGLIKIENDTVNVTDFGRNFMESKGEKVERIEIKDARPVELVEIKQLLPCIADTTKFRMIARMGPPLGGALKALEPLFPRGRYSERIGALIIQKGTVLITIYSTGNVTMTMIRDETHARELLEELRRTINDAIAKGITPAPKERVRVDPMEVYRYLPGTNCRECGEQSCYSFAIRLVSGEVGLDMCRLLQEEKYTTRLEHLRSLLAYL
ncbi:MAG: helix-turn-helix domain-containing protein [Methanothrix sp.]|nr:(Fe-S)-binding protein [Methanothrix sp.]MCX8207366.1 helix-turn-helix domain-containing protein [Methanothrix sp.]